jgi:hypothetical protein
MLRAVALLLLFAPIAAGAQTSGLPSQDRVAAAERVLEAMNYDAVQEQTIASFIADAERSLPARLEAAADSPIPAELKVRLSGTIAKAVRRSFEANKAESRKAVVLIYAHHFTTEELDHLAQLQKDPVLVKMQREMPAIMTESVAVITAQVQRDMPKLVEELKQVIAEHAAGRT